MSKKKKNGVPQHLWEIDPFWDDKVQIKEYETEEKPDIRSSDAIAEAFRRAYNKNKN